MSQHDFDIANQGFPATRADINNALQALGSLSSGATAPATTYANQLWYDTANNVIKIRNEDNDAWISLMTLDQAGDLVTRFDVGNIRLDGNTISTTDTNGDMIFSVNSAERARLLATGGLTFSGDTAAANALDDYEEGTFTPVISPGSGSFTTTSGAGYYTKIGNQVCVFGYMKIDSVGTGSGSLSFAGLPFASSNRSFPAGNRSGLLFIREDLRTGDTMHGFISGGQPYGSIQDHDGLNFSFTTNDTFVFDGVYHTG